MPFRRLLGLAIFVVGILMLVFGIRSTRSVDEKIVDNFKGRYTNSTLFYIIGGSALIIVGGGMAVRR